MRTVNAIYEIEFLYNLHIGYFKAQRESLVKLMCKRGNLILHRFDNGWTIGIIDSILEEGRCRVTRLSNDRDERVYYTIDDFCKNNEYRTIILDPDSLGELIRAYNDYKAGKFMDS